MYGREKLKLYWGGATLDYDVYKKAEADKVMDAMEARIKELEADAELDQKRIRLLINGYKRKSEQVKELEEVISKTETTQKWISVEDVLPQWGKLVKIKFKDGKEDERRFSADYKWVSKGMQTCESVSVTHWMPLPPPPATEESEKED
ncbi:MAG: DUF551 domain-containing protein [Fibrobacter sp.]|nr:DUF551 domain-containing protein [Fibrobacter sp.]